MDEWLVERDDSLYYHQFTNKKYSGPFFELYNGKIYVEGTLRNGQIHGIYNSYEYHENGEQWIINQKTYRNGVIILEKDFYDNGDIFSIKKFDNEGYENGTWNEYHLDGSISWEYSFRNGTPVGPEKSFYENGELHFYGVWKDGKKTGNWDEYSPDGEIIYRTEYYGDSKDKGPIKNGRREGIWEKYYGSELTSKGPYKNGRREGIWEEYDSEGKLSKGPYNGFRKEGIWEEYDSEGKLTSKGPYKKNYKEGIWEVYYSDGKLKSKGLYKNDYKEGIWEEYDSEGKLSKGPYHEYGFRKEGIWEYYDKNGILIETKTH